MLINGDALFLVRQYRARIEMFVPVQDEIVP